MGECKTWSECQELRKKKRQNDGMSREEVVYSESEPESLESDSESEFSISEFSDLSELEFPESESEFLESWSKFSE